MQVYHFDDCPYNCDSSGRLLDIVTGNLVPCPHCAEKRKELVSSGEKIEELGIKEDYHTDELVYEDLIPEAELVWISQESLQYLHKLIKEVYDKVILGEVPKSSYCFGLGYKGQVNRLVYPLIKKAYKAGLSVYKFMTSQEIAYMVQRSSSFQDVADELHKLTHETDLAFIQLNSGAFKADVYSAKSIMENRAKNGKPTIYVTTDRAASFNGLLWFKGDDEVLSMAKPAFVEYTGIKKEIDNGYTAAILGKKESVKAEGYINENFGNSNSMIDYGYRDTVVRAESKSPVGISLESLQ